MRTLLFALSCLAAWPAIGAQAFYHGKAEGWFWYRETIEPEEDKKEPAAPLPAPSSGGPAAFTAGWLKEYLPKYRLLALDEPTPEHVAAYFYLQRLAIDKANRFANVSRSVIKTYPLLDENLRRPRAAFAARQADESAGAAKDKALRIIARRAGVFFFFRSDCPYCHLQAPLLKMLEDVYGFEILPVSLDGRPMPIDLYREFRVDTGQAEALGVISTPALFLVNPGAADGKIVPLGQSVLALAELKDRIVRAAHEAGWIDRTLYQSTQAVKSDWLLEVRSHDRGFLPPGEIIRRLEAAADFPSR